MDSLNCDLISTCLLKCTLIVSDENKALCLLQGALF